jgi:hypothetical protein
MKDRSLKIIFRWFKSYRLFAIYAMMTIVNAGLSLWLLKHSESLKIIGMIEPQRVEDQKIVDVELIPDSNVS